MSIRQGFWLGFVLSGMAGDGMRVGPAVAHHDVWGSALWGTLAALIGICVLALVHLWLGDARQSAAIGTWERMEARARLREQEQEASGG